MTTKKDYSANETILDSGLLRDVELRTNEASLDDVMCVFTASY